MFYNSPFSHIHIELTTKCNAACPMCLRNLQGDRIEPNLIISDFDIDWLDNIDLSTEKLTLCGNYGDPAAYVKLHEFLEKWYTNFDKRVLLMTNGGLRNTSFWKHLASYGKDRLKIIFGIDGLEDTNHLYRRNVNWNKLMENTSAFINAGGNATWKFIIFKHNEHQVESVKLLAESMGFSAFEKIKTNRFQENRLYVKDKNGNDLYYIEESNYTDSFKSKNPNRKAETVHNPVSIECYAKKESSVYIAADGRVYPCCNTGYHFENTKVNREILELQHKAGMGNIKSEKLSIITENNFFQAIQNKWSNVPLSRCFKVCGKRRDNLHKVEVLKI
jgi:MoaA/NifB/PqqE/SkfB family radical SAM enzyme